MKEVQILHVNRCWNVTIVQQIIGTNSPTSKKLTYWFRFMVGIKIISLSLSLYIYIYIFHIYIYIYIERGVCVCYLKYLHYVDINSRPRPEITVFIYWGPSNSFRLWDDHLLLDESFNFIINNLPPSMWLILIHFWY